MLAICARRAARRNDVTDAEADRMTRLEALYKRLDQRVSDIQASLRLGLQIVAGGFIAVLAP